MGGRRNDVLDGNVFPEVLKSQPCFTELMRRRARAKRTVASSCSDTYRVTFIRVASNERSVPSSSFSDCPSNAFRTDENSISDDGSRGDICSFLQDSTAVYEDSTNYILRITKGFDLVVLVKLLKWESWCGLLLAQHP